MTAERSGVRTSRVSVIRRNAVAAVVLLLAASALLMADAGARNRRKCPGGVGEHPVVFRTAREQEGYELYASMGLRGARIVHCNRFLNMVEYAPPDESVSVPFPIRTRDMRPVYEKGINAHNWLYIACKTGLVREVAVVLPPGVYAERRDAFHHDHAFRVSGKNITGYAQDLFISVARLADMSAVTEPVIVNVDAGYFEQGADPQQTAALLARKLPDVRAVLLCDSIDEPEVTPAMRARLGVFEKAYLARLGATDRSQRE